MRLPKKSQIPQNPPPKPQEEEDPSSESDGNEKRDPTQPKRRKISDLQHTPPHATRPLPGNDEGSDSEGKGSQERSSKSPSEGAKKKKSRVRVCSEEDEVCILNHMIDFKKENGVDPTADMDSFHKFVINDLSAELTKNQLYEKIRRFRIKFFKNVGKIEKNEDVDLSKAHDAIIFDLSKKVWGDGVEEEGNGNGDGDVNHDGKSKKSGKDGNLVNSPLKSKNAASVLEGNDGGRTLGMESGGVDEKAIGGVKKSKKKGKDGNLAASPGKQKDAQNISAVLEEGLKMKDGVEYLYTVQAYASMASRGVITAEQADFLKVNSSAAGSATVREFEEKWKELLEKETEIAVQKLEVFTHHTRRVLDGMKK